MREQKDPELIAGWLDARGKAVPDRSGWAAGVPERAAVEKPITGGTREPRRITGPAGRPSLPEVSCVLRRQGWHAMAIGSPRTEWERGCAVRKRQHAPCAANSRRATTLQHRFPHKRLQGQQRRRQILTFVRSYHAQHGWAPTIGEIAQAVGLASPNSTKSHLQRLADEGFLHLEPRKSRAIHLVDPAPDGWTRQAQMAG